MDAFLRITLFLWSLANMLMSTTAQTRCANQWYFHAPTGTCFRVFLNEKNFSSARAACEQYRGGPDQTFPGWLAGIHDANTDGFVKNLLSYDQKAYIGLYRPTNYFYWVDRTIYQTSYKRWSAGEPVNGYTYITRTSWRTTYMSTYLNYVCQTHAFFSRPTLSCEPMRIGAAFSPITCQVNVHNSFGSFHKFVMGNSQQEELINCLSDYKCDKSDERARGEIMHLGGGSLSTTVTVDRTVTRSDDRVRWDCAYHFANTPNDFLTTSCDIEVYNAPSALRCRHTLSNMLVISCDSEGVYPQADSNLVHYVNENLRGRWSWTSDTHNKYFVDNELFYKSIFEKRVADKMNEGLHKINIFVYPRASFPSERKRREASISYTIEFLISPPRSSPSFSSGNIFPIAQGKLSLTEGQGAYLICSMYGGDPPVFQTKITCDSGVGNPRERKNWLSQDQRAEAKFGVSRAMTKKTCTCEASHISRHYAGRSTVELDILYPVEFISFKFNDNQDEEVEFNEGEHVNIMCLMTANPKPKMRIIHLVNNGKVSKNLAISSNSERLSAQLKLSGRMSGMYICSAHNNLSTEVLTRRIHLIVKSPPKPCIQRENSLDFSAILGRNVDIKICVYAYPPPESLKLARKNVLLGRENYEIGFKYTRPDEAMATLNVKIKAAEVQLGELEIHTEQRFIGRYKLTFRLVPVQAPSCPESVEIASVGPRSVSLSWQPASDRGIPQVFTLVIVNNKGEVMDKYDVLDNGETTIVFNVTDLEPLSGYRFRLSVRNEKFVTECPNLTLGAITRAEPASDENTSDSTVGIAVGVTILIIIVLVAIVVLVVLIVRKRRKSHPKDEQVYSEIIERSEENSKQHKAVKRKDDTDTTSKLQHHAHDKPTEKNTSTAVENINVYTNESSVRINATNLNMGQEQSPEKNMSKEPKPQPSPRKSRAEGVTYANCSPTDTNESDTKKNIRVEGLYKKKKTTEKEKKEAAKDPHGKRSPKPENEAVGKDPSKELVYIEVDIEPKKEGVPTRRLEIELEEPQEEPVAYASVNFDATVDTENIGDSREALRTSL